jgi:hypothetical protein
MSYSRLILSDQKRKTMLQLRIGATIVVGVLFLVAVTWVMPYILPPSQPVAQAEKANTAEAKPVAEAQPVLAQQPYKEGQTICEWTGLAEQQKGFRVFAVADANPEGAKPFPYHIVVEVGGTIDHLEYSGMSNPPVWIAFYDVSSDGSEKTATMFNISSNCRLEGGEPWPIPYFRGRPKSHY